MIILNARWLLVGLLWLTFGMGAASGAPVSDEPPPSPAEAASDADRGSPELAQTLPSFGALDPAHVAEIHDAARKGNVEKIQSLININAGLVNAKDSQGNTPLIWAAETGHKDVAELLLTNNADVNAKDSKGWSPLIWAAANGHAAVVQVLLDSGAEENAKAKSGRTPLHVAAERGHKAAAPTTYDKGLASV